MNLIAAGQAGGLTEGQIIGDFYSKYFTYVNVLSLLLQLFVVSRIVKYFGVKWAVMILPCISLGAYNVLAFIPTLRLVLVAKVAENSTDYSLNNTVRNMLFLPCTYEEKFSAKQAIDSFFVRMGDVLSAALVFFGTNIMQLDAATVCGRQCRARAGLAGARLARRPDLHAAHGRAKPKSGVGLRISTSLERPADQQRGPDQDPGDRPDFPDDRQRRRRAPRQSPASA